MSHLDAGLWSVPEYSDSFKPSTEGINVEVEVIEFLVGLVRLLKPRIVVETGCYCGITSLALAEACQDNEIGHVFTSDIDPLAVAETKRIASLEGGMEFWLTVREGPALEQLPIAEADLLFSDSSYESRLEEIKLLKPGAVGVLHDTGMEDHLDEAVRSLYPGSVFIATPRGLTIFQKS